MASTSLYIPRMTSGEMAPISEETSCASVAEGSLLSSCCVVLEGMPQKARAVLVGAGLGRDEAEAPPSSQGPELLRGVFQKRESKQTTVVQTCNRGGNIQVI